MESIKLNNSEKVQKKIEYGDFQTPYDLAMEVVLSISKLKEYKTIIEPTCGRGSFLRACLKSGVNPSKLLGWEINSEHVAFANRDLQERGLNSRKIALEQDFFDIDWVELKKRLGKNVLFVGNPPWVTNSELGRLLSTNLPQKYNFQKLTGLEALTGKSNFDISEWMVIQLLEFLSSTSSAVAVLIKTSVARKLFQYVANNKLRVSKMAIRRIDAKKHFDVSVDACLFYAEGQRTDVTQYECDVYADLRSVDPLAVMGLAHGKIISNIAHYKAMQHLDAGCEFKWRSGVKHDASKVMEFSFVEGKLVNGLFEEVFIPFDYLYPMYKSSHISKKVLANPVKYMLVPQKKIGDETGSIKNLSPRTWDYLLTHSGKLDSRKSSIYKNAPRFSVFGVGEYTFSPWKIVISGMYKNLKFSKISTYRGQPIVVDDTCYMLGFDTENQADLILDLLESQICTEFIQSLVFLDSKRPITVSLLNRISLREVAFEVGRGEEFDRLFEQKPKNLNLFHDRLAESLTRSRVS